MTILDPQLRKLLQDNKVVNFFPVQTEVIPWLIESNRSALSFCSLIQLYKIYNFLDMWM